MKAHVTLLVMTAMSLAPCASAFAADPPSSQGADTSGAGEQWLTEKMPAREDVEEVSTDTPLSESFVELRTWGETASLPDFEVGDPTRARGLHGRVRARFDYAPEPRHLEIRAEADFLAGRYLGDAPAVVPPDVISGTTGRQLAWDEVLGGAIDPRALNASWYSPAGLVRVGLQESSWGMGLLANGGGRDEDQLFNQRFGGDRVIRMAFATTPFAVLEDVSWKDSIYVAVGADLVWRDEFANWLEGDQAAQALGSFFWRDDRTFAGVYVVGRNQTDRDGDELEITGGNLSFSHEWSDQQGRWEVGVAAEVAGLRGRSTRARPLTGGEDVEVIGMGSAFELSVFHREYDLGLDLDAGYASGDGDPNDDTVYRFRFDPNYKVGLILFDHYIPAMTRAWWHDAGNLEQLGQEPYGIEQVINAGAVENTYYLNPRLTFGRPDELMTGVGVLRAWAAVPPGAPYDSFANGGVPTGLRGAPNVSRDLGWEVDVAAQYRWRLGDLGDLELKGEFGILFPGEAFDDAQGNGAAPQSLARGRVALTF